MTAPDPAALANLRKRIEAATGPDRERFLRFVEADPNGGCWLWAGSGFADKHNRGRGLFYLNGKNWIASRAAFAIFRGDPGDGFVCHTCDNSWCVNPAHLYLGDHASNMRDMVERKRYFAARDNERCREAARKAGQMNTWTGGERNPKAKLREEDVAAIRTDQRQTKVLAELYGVNRSTIQRIRRGALW